MLYFSRQIPQHHGSLVGPSPSGGQALGSELQAHPPPMAGQDAAMAEERYSGTTFAVVDEVRVQVTPNMFAPIEWLLSQPGCCQPAGHSGSSSGSPSLTPLCYPGCCCYNGNRITHWQTLCGFS